MLIDHILYAAPDLEVAVDDLEARRGVRAAGGGHSTSGEAPHNRLLVLGPRTYLEVIAPDPEQPEPSAPRLRALGAEVEVRPGAEPGLVIWVAGPGGTHDFR